MFHTIGTWEPLVSALGTSSTHNFMPLEILGQKVMFELTFYKITYFKSKSNSITFRPPKRCFLLKMKGAENTVFEGRNVTRAETNVIQIN